jgi:PHP family Zn ribbon phosphoesterase
VLHRVEDLADRAESEIVKDRFVPHKYIVPLKEIIASVYGVGVQSKKVAREYEGLITQVGTEFFILFAC